MTSTYNAARNTAPPHPATGAPPAGRIERRWLSLAVIAVAQLMLALDATIVNIALPSAQAALGFSDADRQWVVTAYTLSFAGLLLLGGRIADRVGRRRAFLGALIGFGAASLLAGLAPGLGVLIVGRALQGAFAAILAPCALSLLAVTFTEPADRARAFGVYGAVASSGAAIGLLCGGVLTEYLNWRWCLYANVAIAALLLAAGRRLLPAPPRFPASLDPVSGLLTTSGLAALVLGSAQAATHGWSSAPAAVPLSAGAVALAGFVWRQARTAAPLLPLTLLTDRSRAGAYLAAAVAVVGAFGMFLLLTYHLQVVLHYTPVRTGLAFLPLVLANSLGAYLIGSRLQTRVQARWLIGAGLLVTAGGLGVLTTLTPDSGYATVILPAQLLAGLGMGALFPPVFALAIRGVEPRNAGVAAAAVNTANQLGATLGTALLNTVAVTATAGYPGTPIAGLVHGYATAVAWAAAALTGTALAAIALIRPNPAQPGHHRPDNKE